MAAEGSAPARATVLTVDDQEIFRRVARELIAAVDGFEHVGEAASGAEALQVADVLEPDIVLLDVRMPGMDGVETARRLRPRLPGALFILVSLNGPAGLATPVSGIDPAVHVRKQDLTIGLLRDLWERHRAAPAVPGPAGGA